MLSCSRPTGVSGPCALEKFAHEGGAHEVHLAGAMRARTGALVAVAVAAFGALPGSAASLRTSSPRVRRAAFSRTAVVRASSAQPGPQLGVSEDVREAAHEALVFACAIDLSDSLGAYSTDQKLAKRMRERVEQLKPVVDELVDACTAHAPALVREASRSDGSGFAHVRPLARLAAWVPREQWVREPSEWRPPQGAGAAAALRSLQAHLLEQYDTAPALHGALAFATPGGVPCTEAAHRVARAFTRILAASGGGRASVRAGLQAEVCSGTTKRTAKEFVSLRPAAAAREFGSGGKAAVAEGGAAGGAAGSADAAGVLAQAATTSADGLLESPLHALREAQVRALGAEAWVAKAVCAARIGAELADDGFEAFVLTALQWVCNHADELAEPATVTSTLDFFCDMRRIDGTFEVAGRTPKRVAEAREQYELSTITFSNDEAFQPNPRGLSGFFKENATIPAGTRLAVPYDEPAYGGHGRYSLGGAGERGSEPVTIRIAEILSLKRLVYEVRSAPAAGVARAAPTRPCPRLPPRRISPNLARAAAPRRALSRPAPCALRAAPRAAARAAPAPGRRRASSWATASRTRSRRRSSTCSARGSA